MRALTPKSFHDAAPTILLGLLTVSLGLVLAQCPLSWAIALVAGSLGGVLLLLRPMWGLVPLLLSIPLARLGGLAVGGIRINPAQVILVVIFLTSVAQMMTYRRIKFSHPPLLLPFLLLLFTMLASVLRALSITMALKELIKWGSMLATYMFVVNQVERQHLGWLTAIILVAGSVQALLGIYQFLTGQGPEGFLVLGRFMRAYGTFEQPNPYAGYLGLIIPLAVCLTFEIRSSLSRLAATIALLLMAVALAMSWSRGAWLGSIAAMVIMGVTYSRRIALLTGSLVGGISLILRIPHLIPSILSQRLEGLVTYLTLPNVTTAEVSSTNYALVERLAHWQAAIRMWTNHFWSGIGIGNYAIAYPAYALSRWTDSLGHAHNVYLNVGAEMGLVGLICYLILWISALCQAYQATQASSGLPRAVALGTLGALTHLSVHNIFDNLYVHTIYLQVAVLLGLLVVIQRKILVVPRYPLGVTLNRVREYASERSPA